MPGLIAVGLKKLSSVNLMDDSVMSYFSFNRIFWKGCDSLIFLRWCFFCIMSSYGLVQPFCAGILCSRIIVTVIAWFLVFLCEIGWKMGRRYSRSPSPRGYSRRYRSPSPRGCYRIRGKDLTTSLLVRNLRHDCRCAFMMCLLNFDLLNMPYIICWMNCS